MLNSLTSIINTAKPPEHQGVPVACDWFLVWRCLKLCRLQAVRGCVWDSISKNRSVVQMATAPVTRPAVGEPESQQYDTCLGPHLKVFVPGCSLKQKIQQVPRIHG